MNAGTIQYTLVGFHTWRWSRRSGTRGRGRPQPMCPIEQQWVRRKEGRLMHCIVHTPCTTSYDQCICVHTFPSQRKFLAEIKRAYWNVSSFPHYNGILMPLLWCTHAHSWGFRISQHSVISCAFFTHKMTICKGNVTVITIGATTARSTSSIRLPPVRKPFQCQPAIATTK